MSNGTPGLRYALRGPQIEPDASYWMYCARLRLVNIEELTAVTDNEANDPECFFPPYDPALHPAELQQLKALQTYRDDPRGLDPGVAGPNLPPRTPISRLWNLMLSPVGAALATRLQNDRQIRTGRGLARAIENETPGLFQRHILNFLIRLRPDWSPPFQALIWAGLDVTIASALQAAWYYKWLAEDPPKAYQNNSNYPVPRALTSYRPRPIEYARAQGDTDFTVLFDNPDELNPVPIECPPPADPLILSAGTPRHPAYPSGHSTYAGAASEYLNFFFGSLATPPSILATRRAPGSGEVTTLEQEFGYLADNIGLGRMWAGVHWLSDHVHGLILGRVVARLVLQQMVDMLGREKLCMQPQDCNTDPAPEQSTIKTEATAFRDACHPDPDRPEGLPQPSDTCPDIDQCEAPELALDTLSREAVLTFEQETALREASQTPQQGGGLPPRLLRRRSPGGRQQKQ